MSLTDQLRRPRRSTDASGIVAEILKEPVKEAVAEVLAENPELLNPPRESEVEPVDDSSGNRIGTLVGGGVLLGLAVGSVLALRKMRSDGVGPFEDESQRTGGEPDPSEERDESGPASFDTGPTATEPGGEDATTSSPGSDATGYGESTDEGDDYESTDDEVGTRRSS